MKKKPSRERKNVRLDGNWISPATLAAELDIPAVTVSSWIRREEIDYTIIPGKGRQKYLVDRRTAPASRPQGFQTKAKKK